MVFRFMIYETKKLFLFFGGEKPPEQHFNKVLTFSVLLLFSLQVSSAIRSDNRPCFYTPTPSLKWSDVLPSNGYAFHL